MPGFFVSDWYATSFFLLSSDNLLTGQQQIDLFYTKSSL